MNLEQRSGNKAPDAPVSRLGTAPAAAQDLREALEQIAALAVPAERMSPPVSTIGHRDPWVDAGKQAVKIAREALEAGK